MATREEQLQDRADKIAAELDRREAKRSTSERQAEYIINGASRAADEPDDDQGDVIVGRLPADDRARFEDDDEHADRGSSTSRRQAAQITRHGSRRLA